MIGKKHDALAAAARATPINEEDPSAHATLDTILVIEGLEQAVVEFRRALALEHHTGGNERPRLEAPISISIKKYLEGLRPVYKDASPAIDKALEKLADLGR